ncbi:MAG: pentapeptide repeat-containing protein [Alphaproteobacteria bacterium]
MKTQKIQSCSNNAVLFEGIFGSYKECLEQAVCERADLSGADFKNQNLANACLDDGLFSGADFSGANLAGANISETVLTNASFANCDLYNTCFAYADLRTCVFEGAAFGATDITGADISGARFSALSCFSLDFAHARAMLGCRYMSMDGTGFTFSLPPVVVRGLGPRLLVMAESFCLQGTNTIPCPEPFRPAIPPIAARHIIS